MLIGTTADQADLSDDERMALAEPLAQFLSKLHAIDVNQLVLAVRIEDTFKKLDIKHLIEETEARLQEAETLGLLQHDDVFYEIVKAATDLKLEDAKTIVHGDLYVRHLLLDEQHCLVGIIDWGDVMVGNPAIDLVIAHSFLPPSAHEAFRKAYGPITDAQWDFARLRALRHSLILICYGAKINDQVLVREGKKAVAYIASGYKDHFSKR
jgi:aminoglycoside phosphotransferase (APT) family kinase protein